jgi:hypothetical protein
MTSFIGHNQLQFIVEKLTTNFPELKKKVLSNKTGQGVGITRMEKTMVPWEYGIKVICHQDLIFT